MLKRMKLLWIIWLAGLCAVLWGVQPVWAADPVVRAVMFWEAGCWACERVRQEVLPPLQEKYGARLELKLIEVVTVEDIENLYRVGAAYGLEKAQVGVPLLVVGGTALVGVTLIQDRLPGLVDEYLAAGGIDTVLRQALPEKVLTAQTPPIWDGMILAWILMIFMLAALGWAAWHVWRAFAGLAPGAGPAWLPWSIPVLGLLGLFVAGYMTYVEATYTPAVCGPVGDCNAVQNSPYARLFGVLPVGLLGMLGYVGILAAWGWGRLRRDRMAEYMPVVVLGLTAFGTLFSVYLTYLEIFVIHAVCIWCITSAVLITLSMIASLPPAAAWLSLTEEEDS
jgi:uncharacterized membrane protein